MGFAAASIIAASVLLVFTDHTVLASDEAKGEVIHIGGKVLCQDCTQGWNQWVRGSKPIKGSKVSVTCLDKRSRVMHYASDTTDERGQYELIVRKYMFGKEVNMKLCSVRVVSSPDYACNVPTDFGGGKSGVRLTQPTSIYRDLVKFVLNPFYYTTPMCDKPHTSGSTRAQPSHY